MRPRSVGILLACGVIAVAGGWYFGVATTPPDQQAVSGGQLAFPDLAPKLANAAKIEITHQGSQTVIEKRSDGGWAVASMHDYPVQEAKLRGVLTGLTELRLMEPRTSDPAEFSRLGLDDPNGKTSAADLLRVVDTSDKPIAELIVGHRHVRGTANLPDEVYVRRPGQDQTWLAEGSLHPEADASQWLDRTILNISHARIQSVVVGDNALVFGRADGTFTLTEPADHPKLEQYKLDDVGRALELLSFEQVRPDKDAPGETPGAEAGHSVFTTSDGLAVTVTVFHADKDSWARFTATGTDKTKAEADKLNARLAGWTYEIGSWKEKSLLPTLDDLKAAEPPPVSAAASPGAPALPPGLPNAALPMTVPPATSPAMQAAPATPEGKPAAGTPAASAAGTAASPGEKPTAPASSTSSNAAGK